MPLSQKTGDKVVFLGAALAIVATVLLITGNGNWQVAASNGFVSN